MERFDILDASIDIFGKRLLEASAGTGKTFAIEHLLVRLLLEGDSPLSLEQVLVVTFTRAATRDLKQRIRTTLERVLREINRPAYLGRDALSLMAKARIEQALSYFEKAQIFTIHSFCHRMLKEYALLAECGLDLASPEDQEYANRQYTIVQDFFRSQLPSEQISPSQLRQLLRRHRFDIERLISKVVGLMQENKQIAPFPSFAEDLAAFTQRCTLFSNIHKERFLEDYQALSCCYKKMTDPLFRVQAELLGEILEKKQSDEASFDALLKGSTFFLKGMHPDHLKGRAKMPLPSALHYPGLFEALRFEILPIMERAMSASKTLLKIVRECQSRSAETELGPDGLLKKVEKALSREAFVTAVRARYRAVIIDEFQDTDPLQWRIFRQLFLEGGAQMRAFYLVGDPKQSIYGFRSADLETYLQAAESIGFSNRRFLEVNYRSVPSLVLALNHFFAAAPWTCTPEIAFHPVDPSPHAKERPFSDQKGSLHFYLTEEDDEQLFLEQIALDIVLLEQKEDVALSDIAILVRDKNQAERLMNFLKKNSIPCSFERSSCFSESSAIDLMRTLLEATLNSEDHSKIKKVLSGTLIGKSHDELKDSLEEIAHFRELAMDFREKGFARFFDRFMASQWAHGALSVQEKLLARGALPLYQDLRKCAELLIDYQQKESCAEEALVLYLDEIQSSAGHFKRRFEEEEAMVKILTIHASKGLEFEILFALGMACPFSGREEWMKTATHITDFDEKSEESARFVEKEKAEKLRQLYVAMTRAKRRVYAFGFSKSAQGTSPIEIFCEKLDRPLLHLLDDLKAKVSVTYTEVAAVSLEQSPSRIDPHIELTPPTVLERCFPKRSLLSFSSLATTSYSMASKGAFQVCAEKNRHTLPLGVETGIVIHALFEKIFSSFPQCTEIDALVTQELSSTCLAGWEVVVAEMVRDTLHLPLFQGGSLAQLKEYKAEMEFFYPTTNGSYVKGFIDLIALHEGTYYLLDWKTNWIGATDAEYTEHNVEAAMRDHGYFLQASLYREGLKRYLSLFEQRPFEECFGGVGYLFLRGQKVYWVKE